MKKIVKPPRNIRLTGKAEANGVAFSATKDLGPVIVSIPGVFVAVDDNSEITCNRYVQYPHCSRIDSQLTRVSEKIKNVAYALFLVFFITYVVCGIIQTGFENVFFVLSYTMLSVTGLSKAVTVFLARIFGNKNFKSFSKFLAATNSIQNAYYDLKRIPSIDEAKKYSHFSFTSEYIKPSSAAFATIFIPYSIVCHRIPFPALLLIICLLTFIVITLSKKHMLFFWQFLTVSKPKDMHYKVALNALSEIVNDIDSVKMHFTSVQVSTHEQSDFSEQECMGCELYDFCKEITRMNDTVLNTTHPKE